MNLMKYLFTDNIRSVCEGGGGRGEGGVGWGEAVLSNRGVLP